MAITVLETEQLRALRALGRRRSWAAAVVLWHEADHDNHALLLDTGRVKVSVSAPSGKQVVLAIRGPGELIGEFSVIDGRARSATVTTLTPISGVVIAGDALLGHLHTHGDMALAMLRMVVGRLREADLRRLDFGALDATGRTARLLLDLADRYGATPAVGAGVVVAVQLTQAELAEAIGTSREAMVKALRRLRAAGVLRTGRRRIEILRPDLLEAFANDRLDASFAPDTFRSVALDSSEPQSGGVHRAR